MSLAYKRIIVKIGSNVLTRKDGLPDRRRMKQLVTQVARLRAQGIEVILVSSGAVAFGRSLISVSGKNSAVATRQLLASTGQVHLINAFSRLFAQHDTLCSQVLVTKEDFRDRLHYLHMKDCFEILLQHKVVPVVNENDVISVTELMFTDNDELAGLIAAMLNAQALILLTNVDGIFSGDMAQGNAELIEEVRDPARNFSSLLSVRRSQFGRGGMITKSVIARKTAALGIAVHIANGTVDDILLKILRKEVKHTHFLPQKGASGRKKWIAHAEQSVNGTVVINPGAKQALTSPRANSLLPVGIVSVEGNFQKGEVIRLVDEDQHLIGLGIAEYNSEKTRERIGQKKHRALVHYDYLYLNFEINHGNAK